MDKAVIYIHGKGGNAEEAIHYKPLFSDCDVIGLDYTAQFPWEAKEEFPLLFNSIYTNYKTVEIIAIADSKLPPVYAYAVETAIQLTLTELNENLREIYIESYSLPDTSEYIYLHTTAELKQIFGGNFPDYSDSDFYEMEIGTAGLMRNYMARKCDIHFPLERKLSRFLTAAMRVYRVPEEEQARVLAFIQSLDIKAIATEVMYKLFAMLEMKYDFKLPRDGETEETT